MNINSTEAVDISATLGRIVAKVNITSTDNRPAIVAAIRATFSAGGKAFNPTTGLSTVNSGFRNTVVLQNAPGGTSGIVSYLFLVTIDEVTDNDCEGLYLFLSIFGSAFTGDLTHEEAAVSGFL